MSHPNPFRSDSRIPGTNYRVEKLIGSGGMGSVYRVRHEELGRNFVLKVLHSHLSTRQDLVARMRNEWRALAQLDHPNIVQVTDAGTLEGGLPFYVMENLDGVTLAQMLHEEGRLPIRNAGAIISDVLAGLSAAHETGAIHRDIKPQNIFVERSGRTKLLDFGIAKLRDQAARVVTAGGVSIGTPRFMAPEQAEGTVVDGRADIYATALVFYQMLVGRGPFAHIKDPNELVMAHISVEPERADFVSSSIPPEVGDLLQRWLSKKPSSRPLNADLARRELLALLDSLSDDFEPPPSETTLAAAPYDAATLGAAALEEPPTHVSEKALPPEVEGPSKPAAAPVAVTATVEVEALRNEKPGTLGWGTREDAVSHTVAPRGKRASLTPPPISSHRSAMREAGVPKRLGALGWAALTAGVSFAAALGVSLVLGDKEGDPAAAESSGPAAAPDEAGLAEVTPETSRSASEGQNAEEPLLLPAPDKAPAPSVPDSAPSDSRSPGDGAQSRPGVPEPKPTGASQATRLGEPTPAQAPAPAPASTTTPKPQKKADPLPGSGLW